MTAGAETRRLTCPNVLRDSRNVISAVAYIVRMDAGWSPVGAISARRHASGMLIPGQKEDLLRLATSTLLRLALRGGILQSLLVTGDSPCTAWCPQDCRSEMTAVPPIRKQAEKSRRATWPPNQAYAVLT